MQEEVEKKKPQLDYDNVQNALAEVIGEKFNFGGSASGHNSVEAQTLKMLVKEVIK